MSVSFISKRINDVSKKKEGERWRHWHKVNVSSGNNSYYPQKYQQRIVISFDSAAQYTIHPSILREHEISLNALRGLHNNKPPPADAPDKTHGKRNAEPNAYPPKKRPTDHPSGERNAAQIRSAAKRRTTRLTHGKRKAEHPDNGAQKRYTPHDHQPSHFEAPEPSTQTTLTNFFNVGTSPNTPSAE